MTMKCFLVILPLLVLYWIVSNRKRSGPLTNPHYKECLRKEWYTSPNVSSTEDFGSSYQISFADVQKTFKWLYLPEIDDPEIILTVMTRVDALARRNVLRKTWMTQRNRIKSIFVIGLGGDVDQKTKELVMSEAALYGDMVVTNIEDSFSKVAFKMLSMLLYGFSKVPSAKFIGKVDDDVLFYPNVLLSYMDNNTDTIHPQGSRMYGHITETRFITAGIPTGAECCEKFDSDSKCANYVTFLGGSFLMFTRQAVEGVLMASKHRKFHRIDDTMVTGYLADDVGAQRVNMTMMFMGYEPTKEPILFSSHIPLKDHEYLEQYRIQMADFKEQRLFTKYIGE